MLYTKFLKGVIDSAVKLSVFLGVIVALLIIGINSDWALIGIALGVIIVIVTLAFVSLLGVIAEMSENIYNVLEILEKNQDTVVSAPLAVSGNSSTAKSESYNLSKISSVAKPVTVGSKWKCPECEEMNPNSNRVCKSCGYQR